MRKFTDRIPLVKKPPQVLGGKDKKNIEYLKNGITKSIKDGAPIYNKALKQEDAINIIENKINRIEKKQIKMYVELKVDELMQDFLNLIKANASSSSDKLFLNKGK